MQYPVTLLIVEDEVVTAMAMRMELAQMGFAICGTANSGESALQMTRSHRPDAILMDINIRGEKNGIQVAGEIIATLGIPVAFITGYADPKLLAETEHLTPIAYFIKPVKCADIKYALDDYFAAKTS